MTVQQCPPKTRLSDWVDGALADAEAEHISEHLAQCAKCEQAVVALETASEVFRELESIETEARFASETECEAFVGALQRQSRPFLSQRSQPTSDALIGERIRDYEVVARLGAGAMGTVYKARHTRLNKWVALKLVADRLGGNSAAIARFQREMQAVGQLEHANIVQALDAGQADGHSFLAMEFINGVDVSKLVSLPDGVGIANACEIARQAAKGLAHAHTQGLIHRDIKPSNLMLTRNSRGRPCIKVLDLGLAMIEGATDQQELTDAGQLMGTLEYMAPEQAVDTRSVTHLADVYSLGATLYRLLTGQLPFDRARYSTPVQRLTALTTSQPPSIADCQPDLPPELVAMVDRLLARVPAERHQTMNEVVKSLTPLAAQHELGKLLDTALDGVHESLAPQSPTFTDTASAIDGTVDIAESPDGGATSSHSLRQHLLRSWLGTRRRVLAGGTIAVGVIMAGWLPTRNWLRSVSQDDVQSRTNSAGGSVSKGTTVPVELWKYVDLKEDLISGGNCTIQEGRIAFDTRGTGLAKQRLRLPFIPDGSYRFRATIVEKGRGKIDVRLPIQGRSAVLVIYDTGVVSLLPGVNGRYEDGIPLARGALQRWPQDIANDPPSCECIVQYGVNSERATVSVRFRDEEILIWDGLKDEWPDVPDAEFIEIGHQSTTATFSSPTLQMLDGDTSFLRADELAKRRQAAREMISDLATFELFNGTRLVNPDDVPEFPIQVRTISFSPKQGNPSAHIDHILLFPELDTLFLGAPISDHDFQRLAALQQLVQLTLMRPQVTTAGIAATEGFPRLQYLDLSEAFAAGTEDLDLSTLPALESLNVHSSPIVTFTFASKMPTLKRINAGGGRLRDEGLDFPTPPFLEEFRVRNSLLTEIGVLRLARVPTLAIIQVGSTQLTREGLDRIRPQLSDFDIKFEERSTSVNQLDLTRKTNDMPS